MSEIFSNTEHEVKFINAYDKGCVGCQRFGKAIMLSISEEGSKEVQDFFLNTTQAKKLLEELTERMEKNKKPLPESSRSFFYKGEPK